MPAPALGPTLASYGVSEVLADPGIEVFRGPERIGSNDDWEAGSFAPTHNPEEPPPWYGWLFPNNAKEAALHLLLPPGVYSAHVRDVDGRPGVALLEVYDLDALRPE